MPDFEGCPYNGAIVEVNYHIEIPFEKITKIWSENGWQITNPEADGHTIVGVISGSFEGNGWITTSAYKIKGIDTCFRLGERKKLMKACMISKLQKQVHFWLK